MKRAALPPTRLSLLAATLATAALAVGCAAGPSESAIDESDGSSESGAGSTVAQALANSCSTSSVKGLSKQIIAEVRCMNADAYSAVPDLGNVSFGTSVFAYMEKPAKDHLVKALKSKSATSMTVNSMLRTIAQQYLLYRWYQSGTCGIGLAAKPGASNHETGLAIDVSQYSTWKGTLQANGFHWLGSSDPVHFDYAGAGATSFKGLDVKAFQRLWNRNHPSDKIDTDGVWGPQTEARMKKAPAGGFATGATCASAQAFEGEWQLSAGDSDAESDEALRVLDEDEAHAHDDATTSARAAQATVNDELCGTCFDAVCANDSYCCDTEWDDRCVETGMQLCEALCGAEAMAPLR